MSFTLKELLQIKSGKTLNINSSSMNASMEKLSILKKIEKLVIERNVYKINLNKSENSDMKSGFNLAILVLIVDTFPHEEIWKNW